MSEISKEDLKKEIHEILKDADLSSMSTKKVREQLEKKFKCDLNDRKNEIKEFVMDFINSKESNEEDGSGSESEEEEEEEEAKPKKRASTGRKAAPAKKKKKTSSDEEENSGSENDDADSDYNGKPKKTAKKTKNNDDESGSDTDDTWKAAKKTRKAKQPAKKAKARGGGGGAGKEKRATGFTRSYQLSSDLAQVVGAESMPRYEVVKKIWARVKERNLYDPKNKQFAICDDEMLKVFGVKRFRTFSMLKYLKPHFID